MSVTIPKKVVDRLRQRVPAFQRILTAARDRDVNESDTVTIITDVLAEVFGFDKYAEITSEQAIRGTFCDLAIKLEDSVQYLIEVKAIGLALKQTHLRQAVNYGANHGVPWVVLTNGIQWEIYRIKFERPVDHELVCSFDFLELNPKRSEDRDRLFILCREGLAKSAIEDFLQHIQSVNRYTVAAIVRSEACVKVIRRELKRMAPGTKITVEEIVGLMPDVLKREVMEGKDAASANRRVARAASKALKKTATRTTVDPDEPHPPPTRS